MKRVFGLSFLLYPLLWILLNLDSIAGSVIINLSLSSQLPLIGHPNQAYSWSFKQDSFQSQPATPTSSLTYSVTGLPAWCKFNPDTLTFTGTPSNDDVARHDITVTATQSSTANNARIGARRRGGGIGNSQALLDELSINNIAAMGQGRAAINHHFLELEKERDQLAPSLSSRAEGDSTSDDFQLIVLNQPPPTLNKPLAQQLPEASTLGDDYILPSGALHLPFGWSFSIGFAGDTFSSPDGSNIYYSTVLGNGQPLPDWLTWSSDTFTMYGVAPNSIGPEGAELLVIVSASNREDFSGTSSSFTIVLGSNQLGLNGDLRKANATAGESFRYRIPTTGLQYDGKQVDQSTNLTISSNLTDSKIANIQWLSFDPTSNYLSGTPPFDLVGKDQDMTSVSVPLTFTDQTTSTSVSSNLEIDIYPSAFTAATISNIFVEPGRPFNTSLSSFIRQPSSNSSIINPIYDPPNATSWLSFNRTSYLLSGRPPMEPENDRVKVQLQAVPKDQSRGNLTSTAQFYIALKDDKNPGGEDPNASSGSTNSNHNNGGGLSQRGKVALAASLGTAGGIIGLILLMIICRRCCAAEDHDVQGRPYDASPALSDDRTLTGGNSPKMMSVGAWKKAKASPNPSTLVGSPYLDPSSAEKGGEAWSSSNKNQGNLERISLSNDYQNGGGDGRSSPVIEDAYNAYRKAEEMASSNQYLSTSVSQQDAGKPRQNGLFAAIWGGAGSKADAKKAKRSLAQNAAVNNAHNYGSSGSGLGGLGLSGLGIEAENGMNSPPSDNPYPNGPPHSRSRHSIRTIGGNGRPSSRGSMASWEEGGVYYSEDEGEGRDGARTPESQVSFHSISPSNIPVRRGGNRTTKKQNKLKAPETSPMRHRNAHINESPAFNAPAMFDTTSSDGEGRNQDEDDQAIIQQAHHVDVRNFNDGSVNGASKKGSVPTHQAVLSDQAQRNVSQHVAVDEAFEDAEDDEYNMTMSKSKSSQNVKNKRSSYVPERMSNTSAIIYGDNNNHLNPGTNNDQMAYSPNPANSIFGGASFTSNMNPEETMKVVSNNHQEAPPTPQIGGPSSRPQGHQRVQSYSNSSRIQYHVVRVGEFIRIQVSLNEPPPMRGGAPGSPGKRSGRRVTYVPTLERDPEDPQSEQDGPWPEYMEWLTWDPRLFEFSGVVPDGIFPVPCRLPISIISKKDFTPGSPGKSSNSGGHSSSSRPGHKRMNSFDSNATTAYGSGNESGDEIAARVVLEIPYDGQEEEDSRGYEIGAGQGGGLGSHAF